MNHKEKLGLEYANTPNSVDEFNLGEKLLMRAAHIAGFESARKSAATLVKDLYQAFYALGATPTIKDLIRLRRRIEKYGEDEVK